MSVNQVIKNSIKRGDIKKISEILGISGQSVTERLNAEKEIDSVDFINAVCEVTGRPFNYYKKVCTGGGYFMDEQQLNKFVQNEEEGTIYNLARLESLDFWRKKYHDAERLLNAARDAVKFNDQRILKLEAEVERLLKRLIEVDQGKGPH